MKDSYFHAKLIAPDLIRIMSFSVALCEDIKPILLCDNEDIKLEEVYKRSANNLSLIDFRLPSNIVLGHSYKLQSHLFGIIPLDVSEATTFSYFDEEYFYDNDDLGCTIHNGKTSFVLWAPLASKVILKIRKQNDEFYSYYKLGREDKGVYRLTLNENLKDSRYTYLITNNEFQIETVDPYSKSVSLNSKESIVFDIEQVNDCNDDSFLKPQKSYSEAIIYETHIRDLTSSSFTNIKEKGTFKGFIEDNRTTNDGLKAGIDYIKDLGITHLQLMPVMDYKTVNEINPDSTYNWGYDPYLYFVPEGSFSNGSDDSRIQDFKDVVSKYHKAGIRIILDAVFNHVYKYEDSVLEKVVPNYYFRKRPDGTMSNCSWCGNDLASERPMVRKLILDSCKYWIDFYHIDGFRFDLMGILDCDLLNEIKSYGDSHRPFFMTYGEGWNMGSNIPNPGTMENHSLLNNFAFFNDYFRESIKDLASGKVIEDSKLFDLITGCVDSKFSSHNESINYVECHDNKTLFDYLQSKNINEDDSLRIIKAVNSLLLFSYGVPFIHMGQEIGLSKYGEDNTYNKPDKFNQFQYEILNNRLDLLNCFKQAVDLRKSLNIFDSSNINEIKNEVSISRVLDAFVIKIKNIFICVNFTDKDISYNKDTNYELVFDSSNSLNNNSFYFPKLSVTVFKGN